MEQTTTNNHLVLLLGTNLGDRLLNLQQAKDGLEIIFNQHILQSSIYETAAWGKTDQPNFLNQVIIFNTKYSPQECIQKILEIEKELGRVRKEKMGPRTIDIDILFYDNLVVESKNLTIPHPYLQERRFVLEPLNELIPNYIHPIFNKSVQVLLKECIDTLNVKKF